MSRDVVTADVPSDTPLPSTAWKLVALVVRQNNLTFTDRTITLRIIDDGNAFNPLDAPDLELDAEDLDRPIGGLGLHLIKTMSLDAVYAREDDRNTLTLVLPRNPPT